MDITLIGGGNMANAILGGLIKTPSGRLRVVDPDPSKREALTSDYGIEALAELPAQFTENDIVVLAVKPQQLRGVCESLASRIGGALVLSIAAGIRIAALSRWLGQHDRIVRIMPNTPALVGLGVSGLYAPEQVSASDRQAAAEVMMAVGSVHWLASESGIDDITAISGSGPAYVFYLIESLIEAAQSIGFDSDTARELALGTFEGAVRLARDSHDDVPTLRANVTSKGGTTERAIARFEQEGIKAKIRAGVEDCRARSIELGQQLSEG